MLEAKEVNFAYRRGLPVLNDIACTIGDGEFVALLGHNGSGKTTLSRLFMALLHPRSGQVLVDGEDIVNYEPADLADKIGYVFQNPDLQILEDTVFDEVAYGPRAKKLTAETIKKQVEAALAATGLAELAGQPLICDASRLDARALRAACRARGFEPTVAYEVESTGLVYRLLEQGAGAALMPVSQMLRLRTLHPDTAIRVLPLGEGLPPASLGVSYHKGYALTDAANAFIDFASAWLAQEEAKLACTPGITTTA